MTLERGPGEAALGRRPIDYMILAVTILLTLFGLVMVFSASFYISQARKGDEGSFYLVKQILGAAIGVLALLLASMIPYKFFSKPLIPLLLIVISVVLLIIVLFSKEKNDVHRFLTIGSQQFQPSEIGRFSLIVFNAWWLAGHSKYVKDRSLKVFLLKGISGPLLATGLITGLILLGSNLSMAVSTLLISLAMLLVAGVNWKRFAVMLGACGVFGYVFTVTEAYRMKRLFIFLNPWSDPKENGYQIIQSLYALGNGGVFGVGLGNSRQKLLYLPYAESDFILSIVGEEFGFIGFALLMLLFWILIWRGMLVAMHATDDFGMLMATGITSLIGVQFLINVLVVTSSMPPTGVPLPFISNGNTSLVVFMAAVGILLNISRKQLKT